MSIGKIEAAFKVASLFSNPYRVCRKFLQKQGEQEIHGYGETPYATLKTIADQCALKSTDHWLDLGSGRGKGCFWIAHTYNCRATGVEWVPSFVRFGNLLRTLFGFKRVNFEQKDMEEADFSRATVVYLYGTCLSDEKVTRLTQLMGQLPRGARIVSISEPLKLPIAAVFPVSYPWGETDAYLHTIFSLE